MRRRISYLFCVVLIHLYAAVVQGTQQDGSNVIYSNYGSGMSFDVAPSRAWTINGFLSPGVGQQAIAQRFTPLATSTFTSASVALILSRGPASIDVFLQADDNGLPGSVLEQISVSGFSSDPTIVTATSLDRTILLAGTPYWLSLVAGAPGVIAGWIWNSVGDIATADNCASTQAGNPAGPWSRGCFVAPGPTGIRSVFQINGNAPTPTAGQTQLETHKLVFPQLAVGGGYESELTIVAQGGDYSAGSVHFIGQDGSALAVSVDGSAPTTSFSYYLFNKSSRTYRLTSSGATRSGWIALGNDQRSQTYQGSISGILTYRYEIGNQLMSQIGVLPSRSISKGHLLFDNTNGNKTALAVAMPDGQGTVTFTRYNAEGIIMESTQRIFLASSQQSFYVLQLFPDSTNQRGLIMMESTTPFHMLALTDNSDKYSSTAVMPGVFEGELTLSLEDQTTWRLRMTREGCFFTGVATRMTPVPIISSPISGSIVSCESGDRLLQLTIASYDVSTGESFNITLSAPIVDENLLYVSGKAFGNAQNQAFLTGTFILNAIGSAQY